MPKKLTNIKVRLDESLEEKIQLIEPGYSYYRILKKSIDARKRHELHEIYSLEVFAKNESPEELNYPVEKINYTGRPVIIIGSGPAGLFAALRLVERGVPCILLERGSQTQERMKKINRYWRYGEMDPNNNVCFGEGGAGLYSDGKLITRIKSPYIAYVMHRLVQFGAPEEIQYLSNPHVGSDRIRRVIPQLREFLLKNGCEIHYDAKVSEILTEKLITTGVKLDNGRSFYGDHVILATGHSANDMFQHLYEKGVALEAKSFAVGLRIEHPQREINKIQYRDFSNHPKLGSANYKLAYNQQEDGVGIYSFCMCPGGYVLSSGSDTQHIVSNGMSNYKRNSPFANSAIVVTVDTEKHFGESLFAGLDFRSNLENKAFQAIAQKGGNKELPAQRLSDFLNEKSGDLNDQTSSISGAIPSNLHSLLPSWIYTPLKEAIHKFDLSMKGFISNKAQVYGVESRTSCPIRIIRDKESLQSTSHKGLYPCGEGAGYAGGITSAAVDGIKVAEAIVKLYS